MAWRRRRTGEAKKEVFSLADGEDVAPSEHAEQTAFIVYARQRLGHWPVFAIPNGSQRKRVTGALLKAEGVLAGVPDLFVAKPVPPYHGLFIEMKRSVGGVVSVAQKAMHAKLEAAGYRVAVCRGCKAAVEVLERYLMGGAE